jgi:hypothetical protein
LSIPELIVAKILIILSHLPQGKAVPPVRLVVEEIVDHSQPWDFFNGASQNDGKIYGGGVVLYLSDSHFFKLKMGLGSGSNNYTELMALKLLLTFVEEKGIISLQIFEDSMVVINWIRKSQMCHNIRLTPLLEEVFIILTSYINFFIRHV